MQRYYGFKLAFVFLFFVFMYIFVKCLTILLNQNNLVFSEYVHAGLIVILCNLIWLLKRVYRLCWKEGEGSQLDFTGQKETHTV